MGESQRGRRLCCCVVELKTLDVQGAWGRPGAKTRVRQSWDLIVASLPPVSVPLALYTPPPYTPHPTPTLLQRVGIPTGIVFS